jgi:hypothetical protein
MKMEYIKNDILEIIWRDAYSATGWTDEGQLQHLINNENLLLMHTIGYFVYEDDLYIFIAQSLDAKPEPSRGNVFLILKGSIVKISKLGKVDLEVDAKVDE